tara:strand:- start:127 stop:609 length:483 start_codon:yes stop_codon:yes gene_type:complete
MIHYVFDLDDTLIIHQKDKPIIYSNIYPDYELINHLNKLGGPCYIYTNGTGGHALDVIERMNIKNIFEKIYSRDTIPYMKPNYKSFTAVHDDLSLRDSDVKVVFFFDDMLVNLEAANREGWTTFWIHPDAIQGKYYPYVNQSFTDINKCLQYLENTFSHS